MLRALSTPGLLEAVAAGDPTFASAFTAPEVSDAAVVDIASHVPTVATVLGLALPAVDGHPVGITAR